MFKSKKGSTLSTSKLPSNCVAKNATTIHNEESNISTSSKKSKKKNFFNSIKNKISSVLDTKSKGAAGNAHTKTSRSKSFEVLSNSFEESQERTSSSEDSILDRGKWGSKRSQSIRNKQTVCPLEFAVPQSASNVTRTGFQIEIDDRVTNKSYNETENIHWTNSFVNSSGRDTSCAVGPYAESYVEKSLSNESETAHQEKEEEVREDLNINQNKNNIQNSTLANSSYHKEVTPVNYKNIDTSISNCKVTTPLCKDLEVSTSYFGVDDVEFKSLAREIQELSKYGWYWGPLNRNEAEEKLSDQPDGAFLVRDSSDVKYLLSLSFRSYDKTLHTRIEHSNGWFSFYPHPQPGHDSHRSLVGLINHCISESDGGVFCYSRPLIKGSPSFPVRLTKPVSRFMQVRSLQYLCRFVIRQYTSINHIQNLPLPPKIQGYLKESYY